MQVSTAAGSGLSRAEGNLVFKCQVECHGIAVAMLETAFKSC